MPIVPYGQQPYLQPGSPEDLQRRWLEMQQPNLPPGGGVADPAALNARPEQDGGVSLDYLKKLYGQMRPGQALPQPEKGFDYTTDPGEQQALMENYSRYMAAQSGGAVGSNPLTPQAPAGRQAPALNPPNQAAASPVQRQTYNPAEWSGGVTPSTPAPSTLAPSYGGGGQQTGGGGYQGVAGPYQPRGQATAMVDTGSGQSFQMGPNGQWYAGGVAPSGPGMSFGNAQNLMTQQADTNYQNMLRGFSPNAVQAQVQQQMKMLPLALQNDPQAQMVSLDQLQGQQAELEKARIMTAPGMAQVGLAGQKMGLDVRAERMKVFMDEKNRLRQTNPSLPEDQLDVMANASADRYTQGLGLNPGVIGPGSTAGGANPGVLNAPAGGGGGGIPPPPGQLPAPTTTSPGQPPGVNPPKQNAPSNELAAKAIGLLSASQVKGTPGINAQLFAQRLAATPGAVTNGKLDPTFAAALEQAMGGNPNFGTPADLDHSMAAIAHNALNRLPEAGGIMRNKPAFEGLQVGAPQTGMTFAGQPIGGPGSGGTINSLINTVASVLPFARAGGAVPSYATGAASQLGSGVTGQIAAGGGGAISKLGALPGVALARNLKGAVAPAAGEVLPRAGKAAGLATVASGLEKVLGTNPGDSLMQNANPFNAGTGLYDLQGGQFYPLGAADRESILQSSGMSGPSVSEAELRNAIRMAGAFLRRPKQK